MPSQGERTLQAHLKALREIQNGLGPQHHRAKDLTERVKECQQAIKQERARFDRMRKS